MALEPWPWLGLLSTFSLCSAAAIEGVGGRGGRAAGVGVDAEQQGGDMEAEWVWVTGAVSVALSFSVARSTASWAPAGLSAGMLRAQPGPRPVSDGAAQGAQVVTDDTGTILPQGHLGGPAGWEPGRAEGGTGSPEWGDLGTHPHPHPPSLAQPLLLPRPSLSHCACPQSRTVVPSLLIPGSAPPPPLASRRLPLLFRDLARSAGSSAARGASWHRPQLSLNYWDNFNSQ